MRVPLAAALNARPLAGGCCQPLAMPPPGWRQLPCVVAGDRWQHGQRCPRPLSRMRSPPDIPAVPPCGVKTSTAKLEQIQMLSRLEKVMIYWLDLMK